MDTDKRKDSLDQLKMYAQVCRALDHLSSEGFIDLPEDDKRAHAAAYRRELPSLRTKIPNNPLVLSKVHLLGTYLQLYE